MRWILFLLSLIAASPVFAGYHCRVIDFGDDYVWQGGLPKYRTGSALPDLVEKQQVEDVDGDGDKNDDTVVYHEFSMDVPLNPGMFFYDTEGNNAIFYGGLTEYYANMKSGWSEGGINVDHDFRDDFNLHGYATGGKDRGLRAYGVWLWKKEDFLNGGDAHPVSLPEGSRMAVHVSRYWKDWEEGRFVIQDRGRFYISEFSFGGKTHTTYQVDPTKTRWARYDVRPPYHTDFYPEQAEWKDMQFTNVTAAGWFISKHRLGLAACWIKWYAFGLEATVDAPDQPSRMLKMKPFGDNAHMANQPVSYRAWHTIYHWAARNQWALSPGYSFIKDGDMGSMDADDLAHSPDEPVTDMSWYDALAWCNALSEYEGRTPCYYDGTNVLRSCVLHTDREKAYLWEPSVRVDGSADGYRLPTPSEWVEANPGTSDVLVWCWDRASDSVTPDQLQKHTVLGGTAPKPVLSAGEQPWNGHYRIGFQPVRVLGRDGTDGTHETDGIVQWTFTRETVLGASETPTDPAPPMIDIPAGIYLQTDGAEVKLPAMRMSKTELTYRQWKTVYQWAVMNGYAFDHDGDIGSMDRSLGTHSQDEPVTDISYYSALAWCNALSELTGRTPAYYLDENRTQVYKQAYRLRITETGGIYGPDSIYPVYTRWEADGFRVPTYHEWQYACGAPHARTFFWGDTPDPAYAWYAVNSQGKTQPVGTLKPNRFGLFDMAGNAVEFTWGGEQWNYYYPESLRDHWKAAAFGGDYRVTDDHIFSKYMTYEKPVQSGLVRLEHLAYPELGFRIVQCDKDSYPAELPPYEPRIILDYDANALDPLQGQVWRGNMQRTGEAVGPAPSSIENIRWKFKTGGPVQSSPVMVDGTVYIGSGDRHFYALNATDGTVRWKHKGTKPINGSAAVYRGKVFFSDGSSLCALDAETGMEVWKKGGFNNPNSPGILSGPLTLANTDESAEGTVFMTFNWGDLVGLDTKTGQPQWKFREGAACRDIGSVALSRDKIIWCSGSIRITVANVKTERKETEVYDNVDYWMFTPALRDGVLYGSHNPGIMAADPETGEYLWSYLEDHWDKQHPRFSSPAVDDDRVYIGNADGYLYAVDRKNGGLVWKFKTGGSVISSPVVCGNTVCVGSDDGNVYALDAASGKEISRFATGGPVRSSPWIAGGVCYVGSDDGLVYAIE